MPKLKLTISLLSILLISFLFVILKPSHITAQTSTSDINYSERDLIALRILPNADNLSIFDWYRQQGFTGSPQFLTVDGYEAIRDGRTVYVNAANVDNDKLYTNIYLISYNQEPDVQTIDIFGGIINNWKFNTNLNQNELCAISTKICSSDSDCLVNEQCIEKRCKLKNNIACLTDNHCPSGYYCDSPKAQVIRDTKRLGIFNTLSSHLEKFKASYNFYPILGAGSYIQYNTVSTWPSWQNQFLSPIGANLNLSDPINSLGSCDEGYDQHTCFDTDNKRFNNSTSTNILLPNDSYVFAYQGNNYGTDYNLCASFETDYELQDGTSLESITCPENLPFTHNTDNQAPYVESYYLQGEAYQEFNGFIRIKDPENHPIKAVSLDTIDDQFLLNNWSDNPVLQNTSNPLQKRVYAQTAGIAGDYEIGIYLEDIYGATSSTTTKIVIGNPAPFIEIDSFDYYFNPSPEKPLQFTIKMTDKNAPISYTATQTSGMNIDITPYLTSTSTIGDTLYANYSRNIPTTTTITNDTTLEYRIVAEDSLGASSTHQFNINLKATPPVLDFVCPSQARVDQDYKCVLGKEKRGDFTVNFSTSSGNLPNGLSLNKFDISQFLIQTVDQLNSTAKGNSPFRFLAKVSNFVKNIFNFKTKSSIASGIEYYWVIYGKPTSTNIFNFTIRATNDYGTFSEREMSIKVNTYCGDGVVQSPNSEGRGGYYNDGYEDCDMKDNVATSSASSTIDIQYGCTTNDRNPSPYPILAGNQCVFKDPLNGGGFCGDGFCQTQFEHSRNCEEDCGPYCGYDVFYQGEYYPTVSIGEQCWFAKNLNVGTRINKGNNQGTSTVDIDKYCYDDLDSNCQIYGGLYQWDQAMASSTEEEAQGICPDAWHVPSEEEMDTLKIVINDEQGGGLGNVAKHLKSCLQEDADDLDCRANIHPRWDFHGSTVGLNTYNFSALPAGSLINNYRDKGANFDLITSTLQGNSMKKFGMNYNSNNFSVNPGNKNSAFSLRCIKDEPVLMVYYHVDYSAGFGGQISGNKNQLILHGEDSAQVSANPSFGYHFVKWDDNNINTQRYEENVQADLEFEAIFSINQYTVVFHGNGNTGGSAPGNIITNHGTNFEIPETNMSKLNHYFVSWNTQADGSGQNYNPLDTYTNITSDLTFYAQWALVSYTLTYDTNGNGYISGEANQTVVHMQSGSEVQAIGNPGYFFVRWSDNNATNSVRQDLNVISDINTEAIFVDCGEAFVDNRDGKVYNTKLIGTQCWMTDNLNIGTRIAGSSNQGSDCNNIKKYCYNNSEAQCDIRGGLYQFAQATCGSYAPGVQGICPDGWRLPTDQEFNVLEKYLQFGDTSPCGLINGHRCYPAATGFRDANLFNIKATGWRSSISLAFENPNEFYIYPSGPSVLFRRISSDVNEKRVYRYPTNGPFFGLAIRCIK